MRNGEELGWYTTKGSNKSMYGEFNSLLSNMKTTYPAMRFMKVHDAANLVLDWRAARYLHKSKNGSYHVLNRNKLTTANQSWFLYANKQNESAVENDLVARKYTFHKTLFSDGVLFTINTKTPSISILDLHAKKLVSNSNQKFIAQQVKEK